MNSAIDLISAVEGTTHNAISMDSTTVQESLASQASPVANSTPIRAGRLTGAFNSPFMPRIPLSLAHIKGRSGVIRQPSVVYSPNFLRRIPRTFSQIKGRPRRKIPQNLNPNAKYTSSLNETNSSPVPPVSTSLEHLFEAELVDVEVVGSAVEAAGSAAEVFGTTFTLLGEAMLSEELRVTEPQALPAPEEMTDTKSAFPCSIS
ncbi:uncharacterized protein LOC117584246 [Drosophila guanche]|uniref:uncharacterized protein LOC117584246 n=1 Tax=Drosophila guanche TaxID=7266 RepID=UPI001471F409|nr:uncharacterized protein LOC117584246 [Drosophila guanche]